MPKIQISIDGRNHRSNWEIDSEQSNPPHFTVSKGTEEMKLSFINTDEQRRFSEGVGLCRTTDDGGREVYVTNLGR
jgi:hypothetical protein